MLRYSLQPLCCTMGTRTFLCCAFFTVSLLAASQAFSGMEVCTTQRGLLFCVSPKGPCKMDQLIAREKHNFEMDMFHVSIMNLSSRRILISPQNFLAMTMEGQMVAVDEPLYQSIELKSKLKKAYLGPQEKLQGHLFFPSCEGIIKGLTHRATPFIELQFIVSPPVKTILSVRR